jgi:hypothetical protein
MAPSACLSVFLLISVTGMMGLQPLKMLIDRVLEYRLVSVSPSLNSPTPFK